MTFLKKHNKLILFTAIGVICYLLNIFYLRPFIYLVNENNLMTLAVGILPNFLGTLLFGTFVRYFSNYSFIKVIFISLSLPFFMEFQRSFSGSANFDLYDLIASITCIPFVYFLVGKNRFIKPATKVLDS